MKAILAIGLIASVVGWVRYDRWSELNDEAEKFEAETPLTAAAFHLVPPRRSDVRVLSSNVPESLVQEVLQLLALEGVAHAAERKRLAKSIRSQLAGLDPPAIARWIAGLEADSTVSENLSGRVAAACAGALSDVDPAAAMHLVALLPEGEADDSMAFSTFIRWAARRPGEALRWYDEMDASGWPIAKDGTLLLTVSIEQARIDPAGALERALSHEATEQEGKVIHLGGQVGVQLRTVDEHRSFLIALEHAGEKSPASKLLAKIREEYILQLTCSLPQWPVDDAITLVDTGFRPEEKLAAARQAGTCVSREETERWADWVANVADPADPQHPLMSLIIGWTMFDSSAPGRWLAKEPAGPLRDMGMSVYLSRVETFDLASATACLEALPDSPRKAEVLKRVRQRENGQ
jgi:hypothetical protein